MNFHMNTSRRHGSLRLVCLFAVSVLALGLLGAGPSSADALRSPTLHLSAVNNADFPQTVTLNDPDVTGEVVYARVSTDQTASNVTVTAAGNDLTVTPASFHYDTLSGSTSAAFQVDARSSGFHALTFTVTADGAATQTLTLPHIWAAGGPHLVGVDSLSGRTYGWDGYLTEYGSSSRDTRMLTFVDGTYVYVGLPPQGKPTCSAVQSECRRYFYDSSTGLVQIGDGVIGEVSGSNLYTDNLLPSDPSDTNEFFTGYLMTGTLAYAAKGARFSHTWKYASKYDGGAFSYQKLTMRSNGYYDLVYGSGGGHLKGTYKVLAGGKLVLRGSGSTSKKIVQVGTFLVRTTPDGEPSPGHLGVWLIQSGRSGGRIGDGNLLRPTTR